MALWTSTLLAAAALSSLLVATTALPLAPQGGTQHVDVPLAVPRPTSVHTQQATSSLPSLSSIMPQVARNSSTLHTETISFTANISPSPTTIPEKQATPTAPEPELPSSTSEEEPLNVLQVVPTDAGKQESRPATATRDITAAARRTLQKALLSAQTATILLQQVLVSIVQFAHTNMYKFYHSFYSLNHLYYTIMLFSGTLQSDSPYPTMLY